MLQTIETSEFIANEKLSPSEPTFFDIESEALYVNNSLIQLRQNSTSYLIRMNTDADEALMKSEAEKLHLIGWNISYDLGSMNMIPAKIDDLFYAVKIAFPQIQDFSLDKVVKYLGFSYLYDGLEKKEMQKKGFVRNAYLSQAQLQYAEADVQALELIYALDKVQEVIQNNLAYRLGIYALEEAIEWQQNGLPLVPETVKKYTLETQYKIEEYMQILETLVGKPLNPKSPKQVKEYFGTTSSDKPTLTRIVIEGKIDAVDTSSSQGRQFNRKSKAFSEDERRVAEAILNARKARDDMSKLKRYVYPKLYGRFNPMGASTSRWTCKGGDNPKYFNAQNYSRQFKACFGVKPDSGYKIVAADFSTLEIRIAAAIMQEENMYHALMEGKDIHKATASLIYDKPIDEVHGRERSNAKVANFGLTYGMGVQTFIEYAFDMYGIKFTESEAKELIAKFFKAYPGLKKYHNAVGKKLRRGGYICQTALGYKMKPKRYADAINGPTQGSGGECMRLSIHLLIKKDAMAKKYIVNSIHDALYLIVPENEEAYWRKILKESMQEAWKEISKSKIFKWHDIPMPVEVMSGYNMGELEEDFAGGGQALSIEEMRQIRERNKA